MYYIISTQFVTDDGRWMHIIISIIISIIIYIGDATSVLTMHWQCHFSRNLYWLWHVSLIYALVMPLQSYLCTGDPLQSYLCTGDATEVLPMHW